MKSQSPSFAEEFDEIDRLFAKSLLSSYEQQSQEAYQLLAQLLKSAREGDLCLPCDSASCLPAEIVDAIKDPQADSKKPLVFFKKHLYLQKNWLYETRFFLQLLRLQKLEKRTKAVRVKEDKSLHPLQKEAVEKALSYPLSLITGGPGTGKSYTAAHIVLAALEDAKTEGFSVFLAAPTGKAAAHLGENVSRLLPPSEKIKTGTLHALLGLRGERDFREERSPITVDLLLVDECSMIDVRLFSLLLESLSEQTTVVLMGDKDQLPPVGGGSLFADLIEEGFFPCTELLASFRSEDQQLLAFAQEIREGKKETVMEKIGSLYCRKSLPFEQESARVIQEKLWQIVRERIPSLFAEKPSAQELLQQMSRFRVLSCLREGPLGVNALNEMLVQRFYACAQKGQWIALPILITRNHEALSLYNGQMGLLVKKIGEKEEVAFFSHKELSASLLPSYEYAFCISVHKSQGSEYEEVLFLVPPGSEHFGKEAFYTAVTRTRKKLCIEGSLEVISEALEGSGANRSGLKLRKEALLCSCAAAP